MQKDLSVHINAKDIEHGRNGKALIDKILLNVTSAIRREFTEPLRVTGVYGVVNVTLSYRVQLQFATSGAPEGCKNFPLLFEANEFGYASYSLPANIESPSGTCAPNEILNTDETTNCDCISNEEASEVVVCAVFLTCLSLSIVFTATYSPLKIMLSNRVPTVRQSILEKFIEEGTVYIIESKYTLHLQRAKFLLCIPLTIVAYSVKIFPTTISGSATKGRS